MAQIDWPGLISRRRHLEQAFRLAEENSRDAVEKADEKSRAERRFKVAEQVREATAATNTAFREWSASQVEAQSNYNACRRQVSQEKQRHRLEYQECLQNVDLEIREKERLLEEVKAEQRQVSREQGLAKTLRDEIEAVKLEKTRTEEANFLLKQEIAQMRRERQTAEDELKKKAEVTAQVEREVLRLQGQLTGLQNRFEVKETEVKRLQEDNERIAELEKEKCEAKVSSRRKAAREAVEPLLNNFETDFYNILATSVERGADALTSELQETLAALKADILENLA